MLSSPLGSIANKLPPSFASAPTAKTTNKAQKKLIDNVPAATGQRVVTLTLPLALPPGPLCHTHAAVSAPAFRPGRYGAPGEGARAVHVSDRVYTCRTWSAGCTKAGMTSWPAAVATATPSGQAYAGSTLREPHAGAVITSTPPQRAFRQQRGMRCVPALSCARENNPRVYNAIPSSCVPSSSVSSLCILFLPPLRMRWKSRWDSHPRAALK